MKEHDFVGQLLAQSLPDCPFRTTPVAKEWMDGNEYRHSAVLPAGRRIPLYPSETLTVERAFVR
jgi:hypothetical protein